MDFLEEKTDRSYDKDLKEISGQAWNLQSRVVTTHVTWLVLTHPTVSVSASLSGRFCYLSFSLVLSMRDASMYGIKASGKGPSEFFDKKDVKLSIREAKFVYENAEGLYKKLTSLKDKPL